MNGTLRLYNFTILNNWTNIKRNNPNDMKEPIICFKEKHIVLHNWLT